MNSSTKILLIGAGVQLQCLQAKIAEHKLPVEVVVVEDQEIIEALMQSREYHLSLIAPIPDNLVVCAVINAVVHPKVIGTTRNTPSQGYKQPVLPRCRYLMRPCGCLARHDYSLIRKIFKPCDQHGFFVDNHPQVVDKCVDKIPQPALA